MGQHAPFAPSSAARWLNCRGSFGLALQLPDREDTEYSREGTRLHALAASYLTVKEPSGVMAKSSPDYLFLKPYLKYVQGLMAEADDWHIEQPLAYNVLLFGTPDFICRTGPWMEVVDLKAGFGILVSPEENDQLMCYAWLAMLGDDRPYPERVKLTVVQPACEDEPVKSWDCPVERVLEWGREAQAAIKAAVDGSTDLQPGSWCRFCKARPVCPKLRGLVLGSLPVVVAELMPDQLAYWLDRAELLEQWLNALREFAHLTASNGIDVPGWALKPKRATRSWDSEEEVLKIARRRKIRIFQDKLLSPAMAERVHSPLPEELREHIVAVSSGSNLVKAAIAPPLPMAPPSDADRMEKLMANIELLKYRR
jgi:hypothetical protein